MITIVATILYGLFSILIGVFLIGLSLQLSQFQTLLNNLVVLLSSTSINVRIKLFLLGFIIILVFLKYLKSLIFSETKEKAIILNLEGGQVSIALFAIEDMITKMLETKSELSQIRTKISLEKRNVKINIRANLTAEINFKEFTMQLHQKLKEKLQQMIGYEKEIIIKFEIRKITFPKDKPINLNIEPQIPFREY